MTTELTREGIIDTELSVLNRDYSRTEDRLSRTIADIHGFAGDRPRHREPFKLTYAEALAKALSDYEVSASHLSAKVDEFRAEMSRLRLRINELNALFAAERWSRFFIVPGGHIHSSMDCSTCNKMGQLTQFNWLPELSGKTEEDAVAAHGALLCTVCYPSAPVHWTNALEEAAKARKAAQCVGSGTFLNRDLPHRTGYYSGNWGTCPECSDRVTVTSTGKLRAHKPK